MKQYHTSFLRRFAADTRGSILMIVGLVFLLLVGIAGAGYDLGMRELLRAHTQRATDFAATSAGGVEGSVTGMTDKQMREATALRYFNLNFGDSFLGEPRPALTPGNGPNSIDVTSSTITVKADGIMPTKFVKNLGSDHETLKAGGSSTVAFSPGKKPKAFELVLALDNSGSMDMDSGTPGIDRATALRAATLMISNELLSSPNPVDPLLPPNRIGIVNWGASNAWPDTAQSPPNPAVIYHQGVINANQGMLPIMAQKSTVDNFINNICGPAVTPQGVSLTFSCRTNTNSTIGLSYAKAMATAGFTFSNSSVVKAVVLFTDGANAGYTSGGTTSAVFNAFTNRNNASLALCTQLKNQDILVYTVGLGNDFVGQTQGPIATRAFLSACATSYPGGNEDKYFFTASNSTQLQDTFKKILKSLKKVSIVQ